MNISILIYNKHTGQILKQVSVPPEQLEFQILDPENEDWRLGGVKDCCMYVHPDDPSELLNRPTMDVQVQGDTILCPVGAEVTVTGPVSGSIISDGVVELVFDYPGTYKIRVSLFPYLDWEGEIVKT